MSFELRDYQKSWIARVYESWKAGNKAVCGVLSVGGGKTQCFSTVAKNFIDKDKKVLVLVHRQELLDQAVTRLKATGLNPAFIKGSSRFNPRYNLQVASIPTLHKRVNKLLELKWIPDLIIIDECHHILAKTWKEILEEFPESLKLGVTATPYRLNGQGFEDVFQDLIIGASTKELINKGYLSPFKIYSVPVIDVSKVSKSKGDFAIGELASVVDDAKYTADAVDTWKKLSLGLKTVVFCCNVQHSQHVAEAYNEFGRAYYGHDIAAHCDGSTPASDREEIIKRFREDPKLLVVCNVNLFTEGTDVPNIVTVQTLRPTESLSLHLQMVGRALRLYPGKSHAIVLDHAGNCYRHGRPDREIKWSLDGYKKTEPTEIQCIFCGQLYLRSKVFKGMLCHTCNAPFDWETQVKSRKFESELTVDESKELVELNESEAITLLLGALMVAKKKGKSKPEWQAFQEFAKQPGLTFEDFRRAEQILGYKRGFGLRQYQEYELTQDDEEVA